MAGASCADRGGIAARRRGCVALGGGAKSVVAALLLSAALAIGPANGIAAHPLHTTMAEVTIDRPRGTLRVVVRVFADDFGTAARRAPGRQDRGTSAQQISRSRGLDRRRSAAAARDARLWDAASGRPPLAVRRSDRARGAGEPTLASRPDAVRAVRRSGQRRTRNGRRADADHVVHSRGRREADRRLGNGEHDRLAGRRRRSYD